MNLVEINADTWSDEWIWTDVLTFTLGENTDLLTSVHVTSLFFAQNSKVRHFQIIPTQNPSVVQKNYSEKKCSGTPPRSSNSQNIYFPRLVVEQHTDEKSRFSIKRRRNVDILRNPCEFDPLFLNIWSIFTEKFRTQKFFSLTSSF